MRIRIKAPYVGATQSGIFGGDGEQIPIGTELTLEKEPTGWAGRYDVVSGGADDAEKDVVLNPESGEVEVGDTNESGRTGEPVGAVPVGPTSGEADKPTGAFSVKETGAGWYVVEQDGKPMTKKMRKADVDGFDEMSDEDKAAYVEQNKAD